ncbi:MAG TPA: D-alanine--D-alanine ligase family protein [Clostridiales bacterium]|nr:D-alanine--D-alanine ligase family protein [Clostridiales bacterium]
MKTTVGVIFGCSSVEHEVAIISALQAMQSLDKAKYDIFPIYISKEGDWYWGDVLNDIENFKDLNRLLFQCVKIVVSANAADGTVFLYPQGLLNKKPLAVIDVFLPVMHGAYGEDGCLQGFLEMTGIPYTGPSVLSAAVGMDKVVQKALCKMGNVPVLDCFWFYGAQWSDAEEDIIAFIERKFSYPVIVKPANLGSSIGIKIAENREELIDAIEVAAHYSQKVLVEHAIRNLKEVNIAVLGDADQAEVSELEEPVSAEEILTFGEKYLQPDSKTEGMAGLKRKIPAEIPEEMASRIREIALDTFYCMNGQGVWRLDFMIDLDTDQIYLNEVNTIPGSLSFYLWEPKGLSYPHLLDKLIQIALRSKQRKKNMITSFSSNILAQGGFKGKK